VGEWKLKKSWGWMVVILAVFLGGYGGAEEGPLPTPTPKEVILEKADRIKYDSKGETFLASGKVVAIQGENRIQCEELSFNLKENRGTFSGGVVVVRGKTEIRAQTMEGDFDTELYQFQGQVELKKERKENEGETSFIVWKSTVLSYHGGSEEAWSENGVEIEWKDIRLRATKAHYFPERGEEAERLALEGEVLIVEKERELEVAKAIYYLDTEILEAEGIVRGKFLVQEKETE